MNPERRTAPLLGGAAIALALLLAAWFLRTPPPLPEPPRLESATLLPELRPLPPFSLKDDQNQRFDNRRLLGHWTLLSFGYTHCPDICPTTLATLAEMKHRLSPDAAAQPLQIGFVSIDPERDDARMLADYVDYFDPAFIGILGDPTDLDTLTRPLGILYRKVVTEGSALKYVMDHSASLILLDPQGRYCALFSPPHEAGQMARDLQTILHSRYCEAG
ncbi:MAG: SCO family protein [Candidatus Thiodiazotropha sp.]